MREPRAVRFEEGWDLRKIGEDVEDGEALWVLGALYMFKAMGKDNRNEYTLVEVRARRVSSSPCTSTSERTRGST
jgi:hypothetical protein